MQQLIQRIRSAGLFPVSLAACVAVAVWGISAPDSLVATASAITGGTFRSLDWFFMGMVTSFLVLGAWLAFGPYGDLKLGSDDQEPDFSTPSWLSMLFSAGMGVGILFWGVAEPVMHFSGPPTGVASSPEAARQAMVLTNFHWGLHAWAVYSAAALVLAYFAFRKGQPYLPGAPIRAGYEGRWVAPVASVADLLAIISVAFGVAASLVMGTLQLQTGLHATMGLDPDSVPIGFALLGSLTVAYMISATTSLDKGIKWLSNANMVLAIVLMLFVLFAGPTSFLLRSFVTAVGDYVSALPSLTLGLYPYRDVGGWVESWTLTYFVWWIAWAPFVGVFIARISRGRTIREFILGVTLTPAILSVLWFAVFGGSGLFVETMGGGGFSEIVSEDVTAALFSLFDLLPASRLLAGIAVTLIFIFLVTSADSATFVLGMMTSRGSFDPPRMRKIAWGLSLSGLAAGLLLARSIEAVRAMAILGAIPFGFVMVLQIGALLRTLPSEREGSGPEPAAALESAVASEVAAEGATAEIPGGDAAGAEGGV